MLKLMPLVCLALLAALAPCKDSLAAPPTTPAEVSALQKRVKQALAGPWSALPRPPQPAGTKPPGTIWRPISGLPFAASWPPAADGRVAYHVYAIGLQPGLSDASLVSAPWARATVDKANAVAVETVAPKLVSLGIQGHKPVDRSHWLAITTGAAALVTAARAGAAPSAAQAKAIRAGYCLWLESNGVVAKPLRALERDFIAWLKCGSAR